MRRVRTAVVPAAGLGSRMLPATKAVPKALLPIVDKPVIQYIVEEAAASGIEQVVIVVGRGQSAIADHFDSCFELEHRLRVAGKYAALEAVIGAGRLAEIVIVHQPEPLGNGHAVWCARHVVGDAPFAMLWGDGIVLADDPCLAQLLRVYERTGASVLAAKRVPLDQTPLLGVIDGDPVDDRTLRVRDIIEKPPPGTAPSDLAQVKGCIFTNRLMQLLGSTPPRSGGEIWLADAVHALLAEEPVYAYLFEGQHMDTGNPLEYIQANLEVALRRADMGPALRTYLRTLVGSWNHQAETDVAASPRSSCASSTDG
jgi:UTP--glucose-1-phosphate uridylyltransferase